MQKLVGYFVVCSMIATVLGCGPGGPELAEVSGTVTLDGKPVPNAVLTFIPTGGTTSYGMTNAEGKYKMMFTDTKSGAMLGTHSVELQVKRYSKDEVIEMKAAGMDATTDFVQIPKKYNKPGALTAEVKKGKNTINFQLTED
jgi:hypothetical protein